MEPNQPLTAKEAALLGSQAAKPPFNPEADKRQVIDSALRLLGGATAQDEPREEPLPEQIGHQGAMDPRLPPGNAPTTLPDGRDMTLRDLVLADERQSRGPISNDLDPAANLSSTRVSADSPLVASLFPVGDPPDARGSRGSDEWQGAGHEDSIHSRGISADENTGAAKLLADTLTQPTTAASSLSATAAESPPVPPVRFRVELEPKPTDDSNSSEDSSGTLDASGSADENYQASGYADIDNSSSDIDSAPTSLVIDSAGGASTNNAESTDAEPQQVNVSMHVDVEVSVTRLDTIADAATRKAATLAENLIDRKLSDERRDATMREASRRACL